LNRIILECEKGHQWEPCVVQCDSRGNLMEQHHQPCPICHPPEPTYGDLDVETVAKWLRELWHERENLWDSTGESVREKYRRQARAVIRLVNEAWDRGARGHSKTPMNGKDVTAAWLHRIGKGES